MGAFPVVLGLASIVVAVLIVVGLVFLGLPFLPLPAFLLSLPVWFLVVSPGMVAPIRGPVHLEGDHEEVRSATPLRLTNQAGLDDHRPVGMTLPIGMRYGSRGDDRVARPDDLKARVCRRTAVARPVLISWLRIGRPRLVV